MSTTVTTSWSASDGTGPQTIAESHMVQPGDIAYFRKPRVSVINLGHREAGIFLLGKGVITADVPITRSVMTKTAADWIAKTVLTRTYIKSCGDLKGIRTCQCHYGRCGHCGAGDHAKCAHRQPSGWRPAASPVTYVVGRKGGALASVWNTGKPCCWYCDCADCIAGVDEQQTDPARRTTDPARQAYRAVKGDIRPGDTVWLTPKTLGCPAICWKQPRATVVHVDRGDGYLVVKVDDVEHRIHCDNVRRSDPDRLRPPTPRKPRRPRPLPAGFEQDALF